MAQIIKDGKWGTPGVFEAYELVETAAAHTGFNRDSAETDTPQDYLSEVYPAKLVSGIIYKVKIRLTWANATTLDYFWLFEDDVAGNYANRMRKLFDSSDYVAAIVKDTEYEWDVEIPFKLEDIGKFWYMQDISGANGNIQGYVYLSGITYEA